MAQTVEQALQQAKLYTDDTLYSLIHLPPNGIMAAAGVLAQIGEPFGALIADKDEVTLDHPRRTGRGFRQPPARSSRRRIRLPPDHL